MHDDDDVEDISAVDRSCRRPLSSSTTGWMRSSRNMMIPAGNNDSAPFALQTNHLDCIHDNLVFDTYGRRMASCSGDRFVKIWDMTEGSRGGVNDGSCVINDGSARRSTAIAATAIARAATAIAIAGGPRCVDVQRGVAWQAHRGSVTCLSSGWCHPEHATLLATSGLDQEVKDWGRTEHRRRVLRQPRIAPGPTSTSNPSSVLASSPALCVAWGPNVGRRYRYVAAANGDGGLVLYKLKRGGMGIGGGGRRHSTGGRCCHHHHHHRRPDVHQHYGRPGIRVGPGPAGGERVEVPAERDGVRPRWQRRFGKRVHVYKV
jgi:WD40 repeat protein